MRRPPDPALAAADRRRRIRAMVSAIPPGRVASYGQIASLVGLPRGARLVGRVMSTLPPESDVPWHRVLNAAGRISLPGGSEAFRRQRDRLREEGVVVRGGRVSMKEFGWEPALDELLWNPALHAPPE